MTRKHVVACGVCGRPMAKDAGVRLYVAAARGPDAVDFVQTAGRLVACPVCARTRRFRVVADDAPPASERSATASAPDPGQRPPAPSPPGS